MTAAIELTDVTVRAAGRLLLGPLDLAIEEREHVVLCGPSGSGKTTLLRTIAGLQTPSSGRSSWFGEPASEGVRILLPPEARRVGFLFQGGGLWPHMSVRRTLEFVLGAKKVPRSRRAGRVAQLLEWAELRGFEERMPGTLSGGEAQRLSLARALAIEPKVLLLDEPLGPLDTELRAALIERLGALQRDLGLTVLHVTHDPAEAAPIATRTLRLVEGRLDPSWNGAA